jgi:hypothetical protein
VTYWPTSRLALLRSRLLTLTKMALLRVKTTASAVLVLDLAPRDSAALVLDVCNLWSDPDSVTLTRNKTAELTPITATPLAVTTSTALGALRTSPPLVPTPLQLLAPRSAPSSTVALVSTTASPPAQSL